MEPAGQAPHAVDAGAAFHPRVGRANARSTHTSPWLAYESWHQRVQPHARRRAWSRAMDHVPGFA